MLQALHITSNATIQAVGTIGTVFLTGTGNALAGSLISTNGAINQLSIPFGDIGQSGTTALVSAYEQIGSISVGTRPPQGQVVGGNVFATVTSGASSANSITSNFSALGNVSGTFAFDELGSDSCCDPITCLATEPVLLVEGDFSGNIEVGSVFGNAHFRGSATSTGSAPTIELGSVIGSVSIDGNVSQLRIEGDLILCDPNVTVDVLTIGGHAGSVFVGGDIKLAPISDPVPIHCRIESADSFHVAGFLSASVSGADNSAADIADVSIDYFDAPSGNGGAGVLMFLDIPDRVRIGRIWGEETDFATISVLELPTSSVISTDYDFVFGSIQVRTPGGLHGAVILGTEQEISTASTWDFSTIQIGSVILPNPAYSQLPSTFGGGVVTTVTGGLQWPRCSPANFDFDDKPTTTDFARWPAAEPWRTVLMYFYVPVEPRLAEEPLVNVYWYDPLLSERVVPATSAVIVEIDPNDARRVFLRAKPPVVLPAGRYFVTNTESQNLVGLFGTPVAYDPGIEFLYAFQLSYDCDFNGVADSPQNYCYSAEPCNDIDFDNDGSFFDPNDQIAFLSVYSEGPCWTGFCDSIDFNNDSSIFDPADLDAFFRVYSEGPCVPE